MTFTWEFPKKYQGRVRGRDESYGRRGEHTCLGIACVAICGCGGVCNMYEKVKLLYIIGFKYPIDFRNTAMNVCGLCISLLDFNFFSSFNIHEYMFFLLNNYLCDVTS